MWYYQLFYIINVLHVDGNFLATEISVKFCFLHWSGVYFHTFLLALSPVYPAVPIKCRLPCKWSQFMIKIMSNPSIPAHREFVCSKICWTWLSTVHFCLSRREQVKIKCLPSSCMSFPYLELLPWLLGKNNCWWFLEDSLEKCQRCSLNIEMSIFSPWMVGHRFLGAFKVSINFQ